MDRKTLEWIKNELIAHGVNPAEVVTLGRKKLARQIAELYRADGETWPRRDYLEIADSIIAHATESNN